MMTTQKLNPKKLTGPQKAAVFFLSMGEEFTTQFFKKMDENSIKKIGKYMSEITYISSDVLNTVMQEFVTNFKNEQDLLISGKDFLEQVVNRTLDKETAREVFKVIGSKGNMVPFSDLTYIPSEDIFAKIQGEHPQTTALVLSYLPHEKSAEVLSLFPGELKADLALRIAQIGQVDEEIVHELDEIMKQEISKIGVTTRRFDGVEKLANILNEVDGATEEAVLSFIENEDNDLAEAVRQKMFVFEDLLQIDDKNFRNVLQNVNNEILAKALRTASDDIKEKIFKNLSARATEMLREDMEVMGPVKLADVEEAQQEIIKVAKKLEAEGKVVLAKGKEDVFV